MCCTMNKRDRRQLSASLWRWKTVAKRNPCGLCCAFSGAIAVSLIWVFIWSFTKGAIKTLEFPALQYYNVANPSMLIEQSYFCKNQGSDPTNPYACPEDEPLID